MRVFVSHASDDKKLIRPLVDALLAEGCEVFIDRPREFGYRARQLRDCKIRYLESGEAYDGELLKELRESDAVLGCLSKNLSAERSILVSELNIAHSTQRLVTVVVGGISPTELPERLGLFRAAATQSHKVDSALLASALRKRVAMQTLSEAETAEWERFAFIYHDLQNRAATAAKRDLDDPNFDLPATRERVDVASLSGVLVRTPRKRQVRDVERLVAKAQAGGVHPLIVAGPENEAVAEFVDSIADIWVAARRKGTRPHVLEQIDLSFESVQKEVDYDLKRALARHLPFGDGVDFSKDKPFADALSALYPGVVICVASPMHVERVASALDTVEQWLGFWARIEAAAALPRPKLVPVLPLTMDAARPGWDMNGKGPIEDPCPPASGWLSWLWFASGVNRRAHQALRAIERRSRSEAGLAAATYLPLLNPVRPEAADSHLSAEIPAIGPERRQAIQALFPRRRRRAPGLPMATYIDQATHLLQDEV